MSSILMYDCRYGLTLYSIMSGPRFFVFSCLFYTLLLFFFFFLFCSSSTSSILCKQLPKQSFVFFLSLPSYKMSVWYSYQKINIYPKRHSNEKKIIMINYPSAYISICFLLIYSIVLFSFFFKVQYLKDARKKKHQ